MPTYLYRCPASHEHEVFESITAPTSRPCLEPGCGAEASRAFTANFGGLVFKGSGFYETDYKKKREGKPKLGPGYEQHRKLQEQDKKQGKRQGGR